jgi:2-polyprenyl-6-methoxyphenol hydroxylase-like FAD-dependent oxidoreductase
MACFPLPGGVYRIIFLRTHQDGGLAEDISKAEVERLAQGFVPEIEITDDIWLTRFRLHHRIADRFRKDRMFLAGDAAHIHSPVGAQGMNTGIQDALNLASKLAGVFEGRLNSSVLENYERERRPIAEAVLRLTDLAFRVGVLSANPVFKSLRSWLLPQLLKTSFVRKRLMRAISEVGVARKEMVIRHAEAFGAASVR